MEEKQKQFTKYREFSYRKIPRSMSVQDMTSENAKDFDLDSLDDGSRCSNGSRNPEKQKLKRRRHSGGAGGDFNENNSKRSRIQLDVSFDSKKMARFSASEDKNILLSKRSDLEERRQEILPSLIAEKSLTSNRDNNGGGNGQLCNICFRRPKESTFVHGNISHQICCYPCAKAIFKQKRSCPVCRRKIEKITKLFT